MEQTNTTEQEPPIIIEQGNIRDLKESISINLVQGELTISSSSLSFDALMERFLFLKQEVFNHKDKTSHTGIG
jgi:hypothetical protein